MGDTTPTINVRPAHMWRSHATVDAAISQAQTDLNSTYHDYDLSHVLGQVVRAVGWTNNTATFLLANDILLMFVASDSGPQLTVDKPTPHVIPQRLGADTLHLRFEEPSYHRVWSRGQLLDLRVGGTIRDVQLSGEMAFMNVSGAETLMFTILECVDDCAAPQFILFWGDAN